MKTTPLPSVEEEVEKYEEEAGNFSSVALIINSVRANAILTRRDNQAYTRLVAGIEGEEAGEGEALYANDTDKKMSEGYTDGYNQALIDILENVVKPLYGKE